MCYNFFNKNFSTPFTASTLIYVKLHRFFLTLMSIHYFKNLRKNIKILKNLQKRFLRRNEKSKERFIYLYSFFFISAQWFFDENCENNPVPRKSDKSETSSSKLRTRMAEILVSVSKKENKKNGWKKKWGGGFREINGQKVKTKVRKVFQKVLYSFQFSAQ